MKKSLSIFLLLLSVSAFAQSFEGTIQWTITSEITDPALKAKMEESQKQMNSPEGQARMKEMQERMNGPKMKEMMAANPQMKAQMEKMMTMGGGGMNAMMPKKMIIKIKGHNVLTKMEGGMEMEILTLNDKNLSYRLDRTGKTYTALPAASPAGNKSPEHQIKVTKTGETMKVLGYTCTKFIVTITSGTHTMNQIFWTTPEISGLNSKTFANQGMSGSQSMYYEDLEGIPLKIESVTPQMKVLMEVTEIKKGSVNSADVSIPADFKEVK